MRWQEDNFTVEVLEIHGFNLGVSAPIEIIRARTASCTQDHPRVSLSISSNVMLPDKSASNARHAPATSPMNPQRRCWSYAPGGDCINTKWYVGMCWYKELLVQTPSTYHIMVSIKLP